MRDGFLICTPLPVARRWCLLFVQFVAFTLTFDVTNYYDSVCSQFAQLVGINNIFVVSVLFCVGPVRIFSPSTSEDYMRKFNNANRTSYQ